MVQAWQITPTQNIQLEGKGSTLDEITRQLPEGFYSTFRTFEGCSRVLGLNEHFQRLYEPVSAPDVTEPFLRCQLSTLLEPFRPGEARVRVVMTREGHAYIALDTLTLLPRVVYDKGVRVATTELQREQPQLKSTSFIGRSDAERKHIADEGIFEALLVKDGKILEGMTSNFFYVIARQGADFLRTASKDILLGITRQTVLDVARGTGLEIEFEPLALNQVPEIRESFITSSSRGIVPVVQIDNVVIGEGRPGLITRELAGAYEAYVLEHADQIM